MKKKILMLLYGWPPFVGIGVLRSLKFVKYLAKSGQWDITVLTAKDTRQQIYYGQDERDTRGVKVVYTEPADMISGLRRYFSISDEYIGWYKYAVKEGMRLLQNDNYDLIYSSSPPETTHLVAHYLKNKTKVKWVADLRDLWSQDHYRQRSLFKRRILTFVEKHTFSNADAIITVSKPLCNMLKALHKNKTDRIYSITNSFDAEDFQDIAFKDEKKIVLSYMGKLNPVYQDPTIFFSSLSELLNENKIDRDSIEVRFYTYGFKGADIRSLSKKYMLDNVIKNLPKVEYKKSLQLMRSSTVLLLFPWRGHGSDGWYSQKVFNYLGAMKPILVVNPEGGVIEGLIKSANSGYIARNKDEIKKILVSLYEEFKTSQGIEYKGIKAEIQKYSIINTSNQLSEIFQSICKN